MDHSKDVPYVPKVMREVQVVNKFDKALNVSLCVPSVSNSYSMCIEYMADWLKSKFIRSYFKSEYIEGQSMFHFYRTMTREQLSKRVKPALTIIPELDMEFNRENVDQYQFGTNLYYNKCNYTDAFFKDLKKNNYISIAMEIIKMNFTFKIKVVSRAAAIDLAKYIQMAFRCGATQAQWVDMDFNVPSALMQKVATDCGFELQDGDVTNALGFIYYLNTHSQLAFMYKLRNIKGRNEYFIKMPRMYVHTRTENVSIDDGEKEGQLESNFIVSFSTSVRFPSPKFYAYYTLNNSVGLIQGQTLDGTFSIYELCMTDVPSVNSKGWNQYMTSEYLDDEENYKAKHPIQIDLTDLFTGVGKGTLKNVADYTKSLYLSPAIFIDIKLFNNYKECKVDIDWNTYILTTNEPLSNQKSYLSIYVDLNYINEQQIFINKYLDSRMSITK